MKKWLWVTAAVAIASIAFACDQGGASCKESCSKDDDCGSGLICGNGECVPDDCGTCFESQDTCYFNVDDSEGDRVCEFSSCS